MDLHAYLDRVRSEFTLDVARLAALATDFEAAMRAGLEGRPSPLKMLPSFLGLPTRRERGSVLAVDFGGTNVRVLEAGLDGAGHLEIHTIHRFPLVDPKGAYNHLSAEADARQLFGAIAEQLGFIARPELCYALGHTFSFPCRQTGVNEASLIVWTKEIRTRGVEGKDIGGLLDAALALRGLTRIRGAAIINDTVGTLLAAAYKGGDVDVAAICGTGHNTCYLQPAHPLTGKPMIVNLESGNFDAVPQSWIDRALDAESERPGLQKLEKMVSGVYLGEILRRLLAEMSAQGLLPASERLAAKQVLSGYSLDRLLADTDSLVETSAVLWECLGWADTTLGQRVAVREAMTLVARRSARLVAASFTGALLHVDPKRERPHVVAIDGSLYEKMPRYAAWLQEALDELNPAGQVSTVLAKDGSGAGAAIAAAMATQA
jgi:hexokinase